MDQIHSQPATSAGGVPTLAEDRFHFHPRATNPELWRTTLPLVVYERCGGHKGLIATWMAIHWLIVLHAAAGRRDFGVREIAARACVGRNELTGPRGYIQRLVDLGLLQIVGYDDHARQFRAPRPVYHLDLWELERLSLELIPDVLRAQNVAPPPRPTPDPRQTSFLDALGETHEHGPGVPAPNGATSRGVHETGTVTSASEGDSVPGVHETGTGTAPLTHQRRLGMHGSGTAPHSNGTGTDASGQRRLEDGTASHSNGTASSGTVPAAAQNRDVEGGKDRENERGSEIARARTMLQEVAAQAAQVVLQTLQQQGLISMPPAVQPEPTPPTPADHPPLPDSLLILWQGDRGAVTARDRQQLHMLASELDGPTGGYGAYWVGRAILIADRCLAERGQSLSVNYLRGMLRRWQREGSWGSDLEGEAGDMAAPSPSASRAQGWGALAVGDQADSAAPLTQGAATSGAPAGAGAASPPAVAAYSAAFGRTPNAVQTEQIVATVTDLATWQRVLTDWQAHGWKEGAVANMLDRYRKETAVPDNAPPPSVASIHTYPGLTPEQRDRWIRRFHAATTPAEKRAVLAQLAQEHPR